MLRHVQYVSIQDKCIMVGDVVTIPSKKSSTGTFSFEVTGIEHSNWDDWTILFSEYGRMADFTEDEDDPRILCIERGHKIIVPPVIREGRYYKQDGWTRELVIQYQNGIKPGFDPGWLYFFSPHDDPYWKVVVDVVK